MYEIHPDLCSLAVGTEDFEEEEGVTSDIEVKVGQTWVDCDKRMGGRTLRIIKLDNTYNGHFYWHALCGVGATGNTTRIRIDRFKTSAFRLVRDENGKRVEEGAR